MAGKRSPASASSAEPDGRDELVIPVIEDELLIEKRAVPIGAVQVRKHLEERTETVDMPLFTERVDIRRVVIDREIDHVPATREEGDEIVIPVVEEEIVVSKRLILKEEIRLKRERFVHRASEPVTIRREQAEVIRFDSDGHPVPSRIEEPPAQLSGRRRRILTD